MINPRLKYTNTFTVKVTLVLLRMMWMEQKDPHVLIEWESGRLMRK
jgi:hypothetical protein